MERIILLGYSLYGGFSFREELYNILVFFLQLFGYHSFFLMCEKEHIRRILAKLQKEKAWFSGRIVTKGKIIGGGFFWGSQCVGYVGCKEWHYSNGQLTIITTEERYKELTDETLAYFSSIDEEKETETDTKTATANTPEPSKKKTIEVLQRVGRYEDISYRKMSLNISDLQPIGDQPPILKQIQDIYRKKKRASIFLTGQPRTGKSSVGYLLAKELDGFFTHSFNPTDLGDTFSFLFLELQEYNIEEDKPLIVVMEEVDILLEKIHTNSVIVNPKIPTLVRDKTSWSNFMDDLIFYRNVILILTSNKTKEEIDALDSAYLRKGRVDAVLTMNTVIEADSDLPVDSEGVSEPMCPILEPPSVELYVE